MDIQGLKNKILQLAIQGKLVDQDPNDEPASVLLERIKKERDRLVKEGKIKKQKPLPKITDEEKPFEIPESWEWVRLGEISLNIQYGYTAPAKDIDTGVKMLRITDIQAGKIVWDNVPYCEVEDSKIQIYKLKYGDILIARTGGTIGKSTLIVDLPSTCVFASYLIRVQLSTKMIYKYTYYFLNSYLYWEQLYNKSKGTGQPNVNSKALSNLLIPLPPVTEQKRIVKKIDELFDLIDELDSNKEELFEVINLTRNKVLQLAIQGKLVDQDPNDEPASVLLERIKKERDRLVKEGKIRKQKPLPGITDEEKPFDIPESWEWVRLGDVALLNMGQSPSGDTVNDKEGMEFHQGKIYFGDKYLNKSNKYTTAPKKIAQPGDILLSVRAPVGAINITDRKVCIGRGLCAISSLGTMPNDYYFYFIKAFEEYLVENATGTTFSAVTASTVNEMKLPLPPVEEQERIVKKLDAIMNMLDELESQLSDSK